MYILCCVVLSFMFSLLLPLLFPLVRCCVFNLSLVFTLVWLVLLSVFGVSIYCAAVLHAGVSVIVDVSSGNAVVVVYVVYYFGSVLLLCLSLLLLPFVHTVVVCAVVADYGVVAAVVILC